jgi:hypothetical protein
MASEYRAENRGKYESLSGVRGDYLLCRGDNSFECAAGNQQILAENGARVYAVIRNPTSGDGYTPTDFSLALSNEMVRDQTMLLRPGDVFVIDRDHPWCGPVTASVAIGITTAMVDYYEVMVT